VSTPALFWVFRASPLPPLGAHSPKSFFSLLTDWSFTPFRQLTKISHLTNSISCAQVAGPLPEMRSNLEISCRAPSAGVGVGVALPLPRSF